MEPSALVLRFLESIGHPKEAQYYVSLFQATTPESFALISVSESVMRETSEALTMDLRTLSQLGLTPIIVLGLVDPSSARKHVEKIYQTLQGQIACQVTPLDKANTVVQAGAVALVPLEPHSSIDDRFAAFAQAARQFGTRKIVFLGRKSGLLTALGQVQPLVDLTTDYTALTAEGFLSTKQRSLLLRIRQLIQDIPHRITVSVTSALDLLRELFTVRGAGTLIRQGSAIAHYHQFADLQLHRLQELIESAFQRLLVADFFSQPISDIFIADNYRGAALVRSTKLGDYLTKFAVDQQARGEGVGRDLWRAIVARPGPLFWRSREQNPITQWYIQHCDGFVRGTPWTIFWRGVDEKNIPRVILEARNQPTDFQSV